MVFDFVDYKHLKQCGELTKRSRLFTGYACNIKCKFCFYRNEKHIDIKDQIFQQLHEGKLYGVKDWDISGGEPTILPYWFEILEKMQEMKFRNIACITNGYRFSNLNFMGKCKSLGLQEILFSLHGNRRHVHDNMTGVKGSYDHMMSALYNAINLKMKIRINVVVTKDNYRQLPELADMQKMIHPIAFNFLPFRIENSADKKNAVRYSTIAPYIKEAIDILEDSDDDIKITVRYVPFCIFRGNHPSNRYQKYTAGYLQRVFDEYEWSEYLTRKFDRARYGKDIPKVDIDTDKWQLEIDALNKSIKNVAGHSINCLKCSHINICDGIWKSYEKVWGSNEFKPIIEGDRIYCITNYTTSN